MYIDNYDLFVENDAEQERWLQSRPICSDCEEPITDDYLYEIDGEHICEDCLKEHYRKSTDSIAGW